ncbi:MAG: phenylalanine--tRNA ligase subunit beta [Candidatus Paceibacterota bacterium]|jgi:phenylalanyl-tRNA synthetase beta chain
MKISYNWLKEYVDISVTPEKLAELFTMHSFEVESLTVQGKGLENVVVGEVLEKKKHPDADKLNLVKVKVNEGEPLEIVCGAPNIDVGQKVPVALLGAELPCGMKIEKRKVRGIYSCGMVCAEDELGLSDKHSEIIVLDKDSKIGMPAKDAMGLDDAIFEIAILPNRAHDLLSHMGVAREAGALTNAKLKIKNEKLRTETSNSSESLKVEIIDEDLCRRYSAAIVKGIEIKPSPKWLKKRLESVGVRSINNIVDITNYVMFYLGQPMHAFDADKLNGKIIVRKAKKGEKILALDDKEYELSENDLVIADEQKPIAIAGVMGGSETAVSDRTKNIIFESANFLGVNIRKTSQRLKLSSESSYRFEREIDPELTLQAIGMAIALTKELAGGEAIEPIVDAYLKPVSNKKISFDYGRVEKLLGISIAQEKAKEILEGLGFAVLQNGENMEVTVPTFRIDVERANDIIEEIARINGYENIPEVPSNVQMRSVKQDKEMILEKGMRLVMEGLGFTEAYNYSFLSERDINGMGLKKDDHYELQNPLSDDHRFLRTTLAFGLIKNAGLNSKYRDNFRIFEVGREYLMTGQDLPEERKVLAAILADKNAKTDLFYDLKGKVDVLLRKFGFEKAIYKEIQSPESFWHKGRSAEIAADGKIVGRLGEINPMTLNFFDAGCRAAYFELYVVDVVGLGRDEKRYKQINRLPSVQLDLAIVFDESIKWDDIRRIIMKADNALIRNVETFDVYRGKGLEKGKKSVAFRITYQAQDRTLKDEEAKAVQDKVVKELDKIGGKIRN